MTVQSTLTKEIYQGNGMTVEWPVPFKYNRPEHIKLLVTDAAGTSYDVPSNYRVNVSESGDTSVIYPVTGEPLTSGTTLTVYRATPETQILDLINSGDWGPDVLEYDGLDRLCMMIQELKEEIDRAIKIAIEAGAEAPTIEDFYHELDLRVQAAQTAAANAQQAAALAQVLAGLIPVPTDADIGCNLFVMRVDGTPRYVLMRGSGGGGGGSAGFAEYSIPARNANGRVEIVLADIGHPPMPGIFNPVVNIVSLKLYTAVIRSRSSQGFTVQLYDEDGNPGVEFAEYVEFGTFEFGDGTEFGQPGTGSDVELAVSIPLPPQQPLN